MGADQHIDWHETAASALEWWRDAGVDVLVEDDLRDWFATPAAPPPAAAVAAPARPAADVPPDTLPAFLAWRMGEHAPEERWNAYRLPVTVRANAPLMILTDLPEDSDSEANAWMTGPVGALLDNMLAACGWSRDAVTIAGLAWARPLSGRLPVAAIDTLGDLARRLVTLAAPRRVLLFGPETCHAMLGAEGRRGGLRTLNHGGIDCPIIATFHPRFLLERPGTKAETWRHLQLLIRDTDA